MDTDKLPIPYIIFVYISVRTLGKMPHQGRAQHVLDTVNCDS